MKRCIITVLLFTALTCLAQDVRELRTVPFEGVMGDEADRVDLVVKPQGVLPGCDRSYHVDTEEPGEPFSCSLLLFPGVNQVESKGQKDDATTSLSLEGLHPADLDVEVRWLTGRFAYKPYGLPDQYYPAPDVEVWAGPGNKRFSAIGVGSMQETLHVAAADLVAGLHNVRIAAYLYNFQGVLLGPGTVDVTVSIRFDGKDVLTRMTTVPVGGTVWDVATLVLHDTNTVGGYQVAMDDDGVGRRDMYEAQGDDVHINGTSAVMTPRSDLTVSTFRALGAHGGADDIFLQVGESIQLQAKGRFNNIPDNQEDRSFIGDSFFVVENVSGDTSYTLDALGVLTVISPGHLRIGCRAGMSKKLDVYAVSANLVPDFNHDRVIDDTDKALLSTNGPYRFWINDDADVGDEADDDSDVPGQSGGWFGHANFDDGVVNGRCDLLDLFPVWLDLKTTLDLLPPSSTVQYKLRQDDGAIKAVYTDLTKERAGDYLTLETPTYGPSFDQNAYEANMFNVTSSGVALSSDFLAKIAANASKGVLVCECTGATRSPLVLEVWKDGSEVFKKEVSLSVDEVEKMFRWINLRHVTGADEDRATDTTEPSNYPDRYCDGIQIAFAHGYNVDEDGARATASEFFKRLYQAGSRAMLTAVTWEGNATPGLLPASPYYQADVINAFKVAPDFVSSIAQLPGKLDVAAHSLGNMLVSSAITDHGLNPDRYYMIDAAVAMEAYDESAQYTVEMTPPDWVDYSDRLWAANWYRLFPASDARNKLTWRNRFGNIPNAIEYFSTGEDILNNSPANPPAISFLPSLSGRNAWTYNEMMKGGVQQSILWGVESHGGWAFNNFWNVPDYTNLDGEVFFNTMQPAQAALLADGPLRTNSFFQDFYSDALYGPDGSTVSANPDVRAKLLAEAIPSTSRALGRNQLRNFGIAQVDLMGMKNTKDRVALWPTDSRKGDLNWRHSDFKNVAYYYNFPLYDDIVNKGELK